MNTRRYVSIAAAIATLAVTTSAAQAARCGNSSAGFEAWKQAFAGEARQKGIGANGIAALMGTTYATKTIAADRGMRSFKLSLDEFMVKRGAATIVAQGRRLKQQHAALLASIEQRYGVPAGPLMAIWGMETAFGKLRGNENLISAVATLAYDCRRPEFFTGHLYAALELVDKGTLSATTRGAAHGEYGQTQFMPKAIQQYGIGNLDTPSGALTSTAAFLKGHGWKAGAGYQQGEPNFVAIQGWNAATVYQQAIAIMGRQIDGR
jgi:membrane-bound lytic murein transglycosylase B